MIRRKSSRIIRKYFSNRLRITNLVNILQKTAFYSLDGTKHFQKSNNVLFGRTENNRIVNFKGPKYLIGNFVDIRITEALPNSLRGMLPHKNKLNKVINQ